MKFIIHWLKIFAQYFANLPEKIKMNTGFQYIDTKQVEEIAGGDKEFLKELVDIFLEQIPDFVQKISTSFETENWPVLAREAHTAKSSAITFGMTKTAASLKDIQLNCEQEKLQNVPDLVGKVIAELIAAVPELESLKKSL